MTPQKLILASASKTRRDILANAGLTFLVQKPDFDEESFRTTNPNIPHSELAQNLARHKSLSLNNSQDLIIGADQTLVCENQLFNKAKSKSEAIQHLTYLRGKSHVLTSSIAITLGTEVLLQYSDTATLTMRNFSEEFITNYVENNASEILPCVGCYQLEKQGIHLFERVEGNYYTIFGFPLLPCLAFLRQIKFLPS